MFVLHSTKLVSIIVVNWNGLNLIKGCIDSIYAQTFSDYEIIIVDNASEDGSVAFIKKNYPQVVVLQQAENTGFTGGNIAGFNASSGDFIVLLNNDAVLTDQWLEVMVAAFMVDSSIGLCSSKIVIAGTNLVDSVGDAFTTAFTGTKMGEYEPESKFTESRFVSGACAAAVIYRREMLEQIGFLDEDFFFNHEDTDLNLRAWLSGWRCLFVPEAVVYHKVSASVGELSDKGVYYFSRNNEWVWVKNIPSNLIIGTIMQRIVYELSAFAFFCIIKGKWLAFLCGKIDAIRKLPAMLKKRKYIQQNIRLSNSEIKASLMPISKYLLIRLKKIK